MANSNSRGKKVIIIGAGAGGLAAAMLFARDGLDVTILEKNSEVGGRNSTIVENGFRFDRGPTFFLYPKVLREIFNYCGKDLDQEIKLFKLSQHYRLIFGEGGNIEAYPDFTKMMEQIQKISPADAQQLPRYIAENRAKLKAFEPILQSPMTSIFDLLKLAYLPALNCLRPHNSVDKDLSRYFTDPRVRVAFSFQSKYLGMSPFRCPSLFTILAFLEYEYGIFHPKGGCSSISHVMARLARELGAEIRLNEPVRELIFKGKRAVGVATDQGTYHSDAVIINADFAQAMTNLVPDHLRKKWTNKKIANKQFSCSTYMMYLGVNASYPQLAHHSIYLSKDYQKNLYNIEKGHCLDEDPSFYIANPTVTDLTMAPAGKSSLYVLTPVSHLHPNIDWNVEKNNFFKIMLKQLDKIGLGNIEKHVEYSKIFTPEDWLSTYSIYKGATFNLSHCFSQLLHRRPNNRFEDLEGIYLVGGGTHPGSGLPVIFESARITSRLLMQDLAVKL